MKSADLLKKIAGGLMLGTALVAISVGSAMAQATVDTTDGPDGIAGNTDDGSFAIDNGTLGGTGDPLDPIGSTGNPLGVIDGGIDTDQLADDAVTQGKIADDAVGAAQIQDGAVGTDQLNYASINGAGSEAAGFTGGAFQDGSIGAAKLDLGNSLEDNEGALDVRLRDTPTVSSGLSIDADGLGLKLSSGGVGGANDSGLRLTETGLAVNAGNGLEIADDGSVGIAAGGVGFNELSKGVRDKIDENAEGVAIAMAVVNPDLTGSERFGMSFNYGNFEGSSALGFAVTGVLSRNVFGGGERLALSGGVGFGLDHDTAGGRVGAQITW
jgi:hypothetical protein